MYTEIEDQGDEENVSRVIRVEIGRKKLQLENKT